MIKIKNTFPVIFILILSCASYAWTAEQAEEGADKIGLSVLALREPVWVKPLSKAFWIISDKPQNGTHIAFFPLADKADNSSADSQRETDTGQLTRNIPVFLMESYFFRTDAQPVAYMPIIKGKGLVSSRFEWSFDMIEKVIGMEADGKKPEIAVSGALAKMNDGSYLLTFRVWDIPDAKIMRTLEYSCTVETFGGALLQAHTEILKLLVADGKIRVVRPQPIYRDPDHEQIVDRLFIYSGLVTLSIAENGYIKKEDLWGLEGTVSFAWRHVTNMPDSEIPKFLFIGILGRIRSIKPEILKKYKYQALSLTSENTETATARLKPFIYHLLGMDREFQNAKTDIPKNADEKYREWILSLIGAAPPAS